jgi:hypothetical protein
MVGRMKRTYCQLAADFLLFGVVVILVLCRSADAAHGEDAHPTLADDLYEALQGVKVAPPPSGITETPEALQTRLRAIAEDAADVGGSEGPALLLLAVAEHESAFALDVDKGPCRPGTCDGGHAFCMLQVHAGARGQELFDDRRACFSTGLRALRSSLAGCASQGRENSLAAYASGSCISPEGQKASRDLFTYWTRWQVRLDAVRARRMKAGV